jgi:hypothetical protein
MRLSRTVSSRLLALLAIVALALFQYYGPAPDTPPAAPRNAPASQPAGTTAEHWQAGQWVELSGSVQRLLSDDSEGSRHQRFILRLPEQRTLLIAHNIDLAERVPVRRGDSVRLRGRYERNERGGVIHWTHHDPQGFNSGGWIEHQGVRYQ